MKKNKHIKKIQGTILLLIAVSLFSGCTTSVGISPSSIPITAADTYTNMGYTSGDSMTVVVFGVPFGPDDPSRAARDKAMKNKSSNGLSEVTQDFTSINLFFIQFYSTKVKANAIKFDRRGMEVE
jgi:hypothetical protein